MFIYCKISSTAVNESLNIGSNDRGTVGNMQLQTVRESVSMSPGDPIKIKITHFWGQFNRETRATALNFVVADQG